MNSNSAHQKLLKKRPLFFSIGLVLALSLVITAFEWKTIDKGPKVDLDEKPTGVIDMTTIIPTYQPPPPKPKPIIKEKIEPVVEKERITEAIKEIMPNITIEASSEPITFDAPKLPDLEVEEAPFKVYEEMPSFVGGEEALYEYLSKNLKFPRNSRSVQGKVFVSFVVDKDGSISEVEVMKGIGQAFDEEAMRVVKNSPNWKPAKQRGVPVKVRMVLPITFKLAN